MSPDLSVIILTYNEERNIRRCLESVLGWACEIFVVDSLSTDGTPEIAGSYDGVQVFRNPFENYSQQWNWALDNLPIATEWIMKLDADESVPPQTREEIAVAIGSAPGNVAAFSFWRKFIFMGKWLRHTVGRHGDVRVWRRGCGRFENRSVNEHLIVAGEVRALKQPLIHDDRKGISAWIWRHNRYSTMEAVEFFRPADKAGQKVSGKGVRLRRLLKQRFWPYVPCKPLVYFCYLYFARLGFLDGRAGLAYCRLRAFYYYLIELKKWERRVTGEVSSPDVMD